MLVLIALVPGLCILFTFKKQLKCASILIKTHEAVMTGKKPVETTHKDSNPLSYNL